MGILAAIAPAVIGGLFGASSARDAEKAAARERALDRQMQLDLAQNQIQWRVADANKAGIHPLYAMGPTGMSYNPPPVSIGDQGQYFSQMGQDISRAMFAHMDQKERQAALRQAAADQAYQRSRDKVMDGLTIRRAELEMRATEIEIQQRLSQIARLNAPGTPPAEGQAVTSLNANPGRIDVRPARTTSPGLNTIGREAGAIRDYGYAFNDRGGLVVVPSYDVHERIEDNFLQQWAWAIRNQIWPWAGGLTPPTSQEFPLPEDQRWEWDFRRQAFYPQEFRTGRWAR